MLSNSYRSLRCWICFRFIGVRERSFETDCKLLSSISAERKRKTNKKTFMWGFIQSEAEVCLFCLFSYGKKERWHQIEDLTSPIANHILGNKCEALRASSWRWKLIVVLLCLDLRRKSAVMLQVGDLSLNTHVAGNIADTNGDNRGLILSFIVDGWCFHIHGKTPKKVLK